MRWVVFEVLIAPDPETRAIDGRDLLVRGRWASDHAPDFLAVKIQQVEVPPSSRGWYAALFLAGPCLQTQFLG